MNDRSVNVRKLLKPLKNKFLDVGNLGQGGAGEKKCNFDFGLLQVLLQCNSKLRLKTYKKYNILKRIRYLCNFWLYAKHP